MSQGKKQTTAIEYIMILAVVMYFIWTLAPDAWRSVVNAPAAAIEFYHAYIANPVSNTVGLFLGLSIAALYLKREKRGVVDDPPTDPKSGTLSSDVVEGETQIVPRQLPNASTDITDPSHVNHERDAIVYGLVCAVIAAAIIGAIHAWKS